ncbi:MAG: Stk1 family PASTA domain-containing Ser/Thr kinase, partial [Ruminococcus sp.]|nr:Stk1 family PASTA domain-containing Ser/Thr kinase [Ruminococcus sp.]
MDKNIGKKFDGRYEITELIGVGGMADVYKGVDVIDNKPVAVKILKKEFAENEEFLRRFRNESKAIAVLSHPNIVRIYDVGFSEKIQYIVMEYIDGITLKEYIEEEKVLTWKDTVHFVIQILRALQHAHDKGIVHRDIKPQNIMMFTDGTIKVMDFGIAKFAREEGKTATDQAIGSVHYISPEQAKGDVTDEKSDIYSVGAMMYEMLTGKKPFDSDNPVSIAVMHMHDIPERPKAINSEIPAGLEEILLRAMEKDPADRYQSTTDMIADIETFKNDPDVVFGYYKEQEESETDDNTKFFGAIVDENQSETGYDEDSQESSEYNVDYSSDQSDYNYDDYSDDDEDDDEEEEQRSSLVVPVLTAAIVVVIIVAVIFVASLVSNMFKDDSKRGDFIMPDLVGMDYNDAVNKYGNNINIQENGYEYNEKESGCIIEQSVDPGTEFKKGDIVKVVISKGLETVKIPTGLANMNAELAQSTLTEIGLKCEIKNSSSQEVEEGNVIKTEPEEGVEVDKGSTVILYVSMGMDLGQIAVEDYVGQLVEDAKTMAEYDGLIPVIETTHAYEPEGQVVKQSIEPKVIVEQGTEIILYVSDGILPEGEMPFTIPFPVDASGRFVIDFLITNDDGTTASISTPMINPIVMSDVTTNIKGAGEKVLVKAVLTNMNTGYSATLGEYSFNFATNGIRVLSENIDGAFQAVGGIL